VKPDRRSGTDRRSTSRYGLLLEIEYEDRKGRHPGTLSDISPTGCFILGKGEVADGDDVRVFLPLSSGMTVQFEGEIANHVLEIGFAVNFLNLSEAQTEFLDNFIAVHDNSLGARR
jgi:hypothetical protein